MKNIYVDVERCIKVQLKRIHDERNNLLESPVLISAILLILFKPPYFNEIEVVDNIYNFICVMILVFFLIIAIYLKLTSKIIWLISYYGIIFVSTLYNSGNIMAFLKENIYSFALCLVFAVYGDIALATFLNAFNAVHLYIYINLLTVLAFPGGLYKSEIYTQNWFLGYKNPMIRLLLPIVCISFVNSIIKYERITVYNYFILIITIITAFLVKSANGVVTVMIWTFFLILSIFVPRIYRIINEKTVLIFYLLFIAVLFFVKIPNFVFSLLNIVGKKNSFMGRYRLWKIIIKRIKEHPLGGYGFLQGDEFVKFSNLRWASHAHNWILNILILGGVILLVAFLYGFFCMSRSLSKYREKSACIIVSITVMCFLVMGIDEAMTNSVFIYPIFILGMDLGKLFDSKCENAKILVSW